jgi:transcriptional regulator with XRE-family HTH domain
MSQWPGLGDRIKQRLVELGYQQTNGKPDILGFSLKHSYIAMYLYKWANAGVMPSRENIERLARDLNVSAPWLLFGGEVDKAPAHPRKRGRRALGCLVAALAFTASSMVPVAVEPSRSATPNASTSYRRWRLYWWGLSGISPTTLRTGLA